MKEIDKAQLLWSMFLIWLFIIYSVSLFMFGKMTGKPIDCYREPEKTYEAEYTELSLEYAELTLRVKILLSEHKKLRYYFEP